MSGYGMAARVRKAAIQWSLAPTEAKLKPTHVFFAG
jgi:hypothetical protein